MHYWLGRAAARDRPNGGPLVTRLHNCVNRAIRTGVLQPLWASELVHCVLTIIPCLQKPALLSLARSLSWLCAMSRMGRQRLRRVYLYDYASCRRALAAVAVAAAKQLEQQEAGVVPTVHRVITSRSKSKRKRELTRPLGYEAREVVSLMHQFLRGGVLVPDTFCEYMAHNLAQLSHMDLATLLGCVARQTHGNVEQSPAHAQVLDEVTQLCDSTSTWDAPSWPASMACGLHAHAIQTITYTGHNCTGHNYTGHGCIGGP